MLILHRISNENFTRKINENHLSQKVSDHFKNNIGPLRPRNNQSNKHVSNIRKYIQTILQKVIHFEPHIALPLILAHLTICLPNQTIFREKPVSFQIANFHLFPIDRTECFVSGTLIQNDYNHNLKNIENKFVFTEFVNFSRPTHTNFKGLSHLSDEQNANENFSYEV